MSLFPQDIYERWVAGEAATQLAAEVGVGYTTMRARLFAEARRRGDTPDRRCSPYGECVHPVKVSFYTTAEQHQELLKTGESITRFVREAVEEKLAKRQSEPAAV